MKTTIRQNESIILVLKKHWVSLISPMFWTIVFLTVSYLGLSSEFGMIFLIGGALSILWFLYVIIDRKNNIWVVTDQRVIDEYGVFTVNSKESALDKIQNISYHQPLIGRILNYGDVQIQTSAEEGATVHRLVEKPRHLKDTITKYQDEFRDRQIKEQAQNLADAMQNKAPEEDNSSPFDDIAKLHDLMKKGILTVEEFEEKKQQILKEI